MIAAMSTQVWGVWVHFMAFANKYAESFKELCARMTGGLSGKTCEKRYAERVWSRDENGKSVWKYSDLKTCGAPIFKSAQTGFDLPCGACQIRHEEMVSLTRQFLCSARSDSEGDLNAAAHGARHVAFGTGCDWEKVLAQAKREHKREREWTKNLKNKNNKGAVGV